MNKETQDYYENYFSLFMTDGWKQLMEEFSSNAFNINSVEATKDPDDMYFRKGQLNVLAHLINMESIVNTNYDQASDDEDD
jgi:hypothetical protein